MIVILSDWFTGQPTPMQALSLLAVLAVVAAIVLVAKVLFGVVDAVFDQWDTR